MDQLACCLPDVRGIWVLSPTGSQHIVGKKQMWGRRVVSLANSLRKRNSVGSFLCGLQIGLACSYIALLISHLMSNWSTVLLDFLSCAEWGTVFPSSESAHNGLGVWHDCNPAREEKELFHRLEADASWKHTCWEFSDGLAHYAPELRGRRGLSSTGGKNFEGKKRVIDRVALSSSWGQCCEWKETVGLFLLFVFLHIFHFELSTMVHLCASMYYSYYHCYYDYYYYLNFTAIV